VVSVVFQNISSGPLFVAEIHVFFLEEEISIFIAFEVSRGFPESFQANNGILPRLGNDRFVQYPFKLIILHSSRHGIGSILKMLH
jgi:hypothetical protein